MESLGPRIKQLRLHAQLNKAALARRVGVSDVTISYWESGAIKQIGHERLVALAEALGCPLSQLLDDGALGGQQPLRLSHHLPLPWSAQGAPTLMLDGEKAAAYLVAAAGDEAFEALPAGALAAIRPLSLFQGTGLYLVEVEGRLDLHRLEAEPEGIDLHGKVVARWARLEE
ncbi:helix-turn-helix transcriptional regulator [Halomonas pacifica]|uniref:helix-turn-helix domain-containing protein n=1 Tax=Bisbaumannia pacifica TaxID=77098 RepID=UPI002358805D|nr:helix-turn-helix transcriptional regulator [Halomonas pacifica]MDC8802439.1 helix-turn-helix transcriptional regulator [Halomonas pacifica]